MNEDIEMERLLYTESQRQAAYKAGWDDHAAIVWQPIYAGTEWAGWTAVVRPDPDPRFVPGPDDTWYFATEPEPPTRIFLWIGVSVVVAAILLWVTLR